MKNILVPTDFSRCSVNALHHAAALSKLTGSKIYLVHVYQVPVPSSDFPVVDFPVEDMEKEFEKDMQRMVDDLHVTDGADVEVMVMSTIGITTFEIDRLVDEKNISLIMMGMRGKATKMDRMLGSTATEMIKKATCALMLIPEEASFHTPDRIAVAFDFKHPDDIKRMGITKEFARRFNATVMAFSIVSDEIEPGKADVYSQLENYLSDFTHSINFPVHEKIQDGILNFAYEQKANLLVMFHHSHNIFARMFATIYSKEISFDIKIPLMVINDRAKDYPVIYF